MLWGISFFNYADRQAVFSVFPLLEREMHLDAVQLGWLGSSFAIAYGLFSPLAGFIVDRIRRRTAVLAGLQIWSIVCTLTALSRNFTGLLSFRTAEGLGETVYYPASMSMVADYHGHATRSRAMAFHQTSVYVGTIAGGFFAGLISQYYGWRLSFVVFGCLGIALGMVLRKFLKEPQRGASEVSGAPIERKVPAAEVLRTLFNTPTALLLMAAFLCANFVAVVLLSWMPRFLFERYHMSLAMSGLTATIYVQLASMIAGPFGGWLADSLRKRTLRGRLIVQLIGVAGGAPFVALCGMTHSPFWLVIALTAWGLFKGIYDSNTWASLFDVVRPEVRGSIAGLMNMIGWLGGGGTAPIVIGVVSIHYGLGTAIAFASAVYVAAAIFLLIAIIGFVHRDALRLAPN